MTLSATEMQWARETARFAAQWAGHPLRDIGPVREEVLSSALVLAAAIKCQDWELASEALLTIDVPPSRYICIHCTLLAAVDDFHRASRAAEQEWDGSLLAALCDAREYPGRFARELARNSLLTCTAVSDGEEG